MAGKFFQLTSSSLLPITCAPLAGTRGGGSGAAAAEEHEAVGGSNGGCSGVSVEDGPVEEVELERINDERGNAVPTLKRRPESGLAPYYPLRPRS